MGGVRGGWEANEEEGWLGEGAVHRQVKARGGEGGEGSGEQWCTNTWNKV